MHAKLGFAWSRNGESHAPTRRSRTLLTFRLYVFSPLEIANAAALCQLDAVKCQERASDHLCS